MTALHEALRRQGRMRTQRDTDSAPPTNGTASPTEAAWNGRTRGGLVGNWIFITVVRLFGLRCAYALLIPVAFYFLFAAPKAVKASALWRQRVGYWSRSRLRRLWDAYRHFFCFGQMLLDRLAIIGRQGRGFHFQFEGEEHLVAALSQKRGLVLVSAHIGNWEAASHIIFKHRVPVNIVAYEGERRRLRQLFDRAFQGRQFSVISADGGPDSSIAIMAALRRGEIVAMHGDRCLGPNGVYCQFLNAAVRLPTGPYIVAAISGAPLIHAFALREGTYRYRLLACPPRQLSFAGHEDRGPLVQQWTQDFATQLEQVVRAYPLQWHNFYDFWADAARKEGPP